MSAVRPKPWEKSVVESSSPIESSTNNNSSSLATSAPSVPPIPNISSTSTPNSSVGGPNSTYNSAYGSSSYGTYGNGYGMSNYSGLGGLNRYGSMGGYGGYGGINGYGGYGGMSGLGLGGIGMGGMGGMGMNGMGMNGMGMNGINQPGGFADATSRTFQVLENVVYAVSAVAALLESTYFATYNSFFTILGVADQLGHIGGGVGGALKDTVTGVSDSVKLISDGSDNGSSPRGPLGIFALLTWLKRLLKRLFGFSSRRENSAHTLLREFSAWRNGIHHKDQTRKKQKNGLNLKPLLVFLVALIGLPVVMSKFVRYIEQYNQRAQSINGTQRLNSINGIQGVYPNVEIDPKSLEFARAIYDYIPEREDENPNGWKELKLLRGNLVAILNDIDGWSNCRTRDGRVGYVPTSYLEVVKRGQKPKNKSEESA